EVRVDVRQPLPRADPADEGQAVRSQRQVPLRIELDVPSGKDALDAPDDFRGLLPVRGGQLRLGRKRVEHLVRGRPHRLTTASVTGRPATTAPTGSRTWSVSRVAPPASTSATRRSTIRSRLTPAAAPGPSERSRPVSEMTSAAAEVVARTMSECGRPTASIFVIVIAR